MSKKVPALSVRSKDGSVRTFAKATPQQVRASLAEKYGRAGVAELPIQEVRAPILGHMPRKLAAG